MDDGLSLLTHLEGEGHIVIDGHVGVEGIGLEDHGDVPVLGLHLVHPFAVKEEVTFRNGVEAGDHAKEGALATARRSQDDAEVLVLDDQVDVADGEVFPSLVLFTDID